MDSSARTPRVREDCQYTTYRTEPVQPNDTAVSRFHSIIAHLSLLQSQLPRRHHNAAMLADKTLNTVRGEWLAVSLHSGTSHSNPHELAAHDKLLLATALPGIRSPASLPVPPAPNAPAATAFLTSRLPPPLPRPLPTPGPLTPPSPTNLLTPSHPAHSFNRTIALDTLQHSADFPKVLDITCLHTEFGQGRLVPSMHGAHTFALLYLSWLSIWGCPNTVMTDRGTEAENDAFINALHSMGFHWRPIPTEAP